MIDRKFERQEGTTNAQIAKYLSNLVVEDYDALEQTGENNLLEALRREQPDVASKIEALAGFGQFARSINSNDTRMEPMINGEMPACRQAGKMDESD